MALQYRAALSRSKEARAVYGSSLAPTSLGSIAALPIKGKKQTKSQRKAAAAAAKQPPPPRVIQWVEECLDEHVWELIFEHLDVRSLCHSKLVCRHFRRLGEMPLPWMHLHAAEWCGRHHPLPYAYRQCTWTQLWTMQRERHAISVPLSTRAEVNQSPDGRSIEIVNNSMLRSLQFGAVESIRSKAPLPPGPSSVALGRRVSYFEVECKTYISVGFVHLSDTPSAKRAYGFGSDAHVGWHPLSFGLHTNSRSLVFHTGEDAFTTSVEDGWTEVFPGESETLGCGYDEDSSRVFFTRNGRFLAELEVPRGNQYAAAISINDLYASVRVNWGQLPFVFALETHIVANAP
ncbi:hypothetical protein LEN26_009815 [Aphanomyces euteiches]|nr:hypothetical protein LEN26_009815 [Aphanomyces euteiches]